MCQSITLFVGILVSISLNLEFHMKQPLVSNLSIPGCNMKMTLGIIKQ